jgi:hypothetical protein
MKYLREQCKPQFITARADTFYTLPSTKMGRATSFGYGLRLNIAGGQRAPPPNIYKLPSTFDLSGKKAYVYSFGTPPSTDPKEPIPSFVNIPGPGAYNILKPTGAEMSKYSFRPRCLNLCNLHNYDVVVGKTAQKTPGPGSYTSTPGISALGNQFFSKFESSKAAHFNPPSSLRFNEVGKKLKEIPGPGHYTSPSAITNNGKYFVTKFKSSMCRSFGNEDRYALANKTTNLCISHFI